MSIGIWTVLAFRDDRDTLRAGTIVEMDADEDTAVVQEFATGARFGVDLWDEATYTVIDRLPAERSAS